MTFTEVVAKIADRLNLTSPASLVRIGEEVNERYREVLSGVGLQGSVRTTASATVTVGSRYLTFTCEKIFDIFDQSGRNVTSINRSGSTATVITDIPHGYQTGVVVTIAGALQTEYNGVFQITVVDATTFTVTVSGAPVTPATGTITVETQQTQNILGERSFDELRYMALSTSDPAQNWAVQNMGASTVTVFLDSAPSAAYVLNADVEMNITDLSGSQIPAFSQDFHDILIKGGLADELYKMEKYDLSDVQEKRYEKRLGELRLFIAKSGGLEIYQGKMLPGLYPGVSLVR